MFKSDSRFPAVKSFRINATRLGNVEADDVTLEAESDKQVDIKDLSWQDKERVLRILFAKMNGLSVVQNYREYGIEGEAVQQKEIRGYRGAAYPIGPDAFTGSMADKVDRIVSIDDDHQDAKEGGSDDDEAVAQEEQDAQELPDIKIGLPVLPSIELPTITMDESYELPSFTISPAALPPILVIDEE